MRNRLVGLAIGILIAIGLAQAQTTINRNFGTPATLPVNLTSGVTGALPVANGGTNVTSATDDSVLVGNGTTWQIKAIGDCLDTTGNHLNYTASSNTWGCGTSLNTSPTLVAPVVSTTPNPVIRIIDTAGTADQKNTLIRLGGSPAASFQICSATDAAATTPVTCLISGARTAAAWSAVALGNSTDNPTFTVNAVDMAPLANSFTATFDDACTTSPTYTINYQKIGRMVTLFIANSSGFACTGDSTNFATTGTPVPAAIRPAGTANGYVVAGYTDNSATTLAMMSVTAAGNVTISRISGTTTAAWTASGNRSIPGVGYSQTYFIN